MATNRDYYKMMSQFTNPYSLRNMVGEYVVGGAISGIKNRFGIEFRVSTNEMQKAFKWIEKYDKKYDKHISNPQLLLERHNKDLNKSNMYICDKKFVFKLNNRTFCYVDAGPSRSDKSNNYNNESDMDRLPANLFIYVFGKNMLKYARELAKELTDTTKEYLTIYKVSGGNSNNKDERLYFEVISSDLHTRPMDTLFFDDDVKEQIIDHLNKFLSNEKTYKDRSLLYKTGILLHGSPGTGKSSLATAIATHYGYDVISIDMSTFKSLDVNCLVEAINADSCKYVVLLEDIDAVVRSREGNNDKEDREIINRLLSFLDSTSSPTDVIFIATTNYPNTLDPALTRDGRFDKKLEVKELSIKNVVEMCKSFDLTDEQIKTIQNKIKEDGKDHINQSKLQNMILSVLEKMPIEDSNIEESGEQKIEEPVNPTVDEAEPISNYTS